MAPLHPVILGAERAWPAELGHVHSVNMFHMFLSAPKSEKLRLVGEVDSNVCFATSLCMDGVLEAVENIRYMKSLAMDNSALSHLTQWW